MSDAGIFISAPHTRTLAGELLPLALMLT